MRTEITDKSAQEVYEIKYALTAALGVLDYSIVASPERVWLRF